MYSIGKKLYGHKGLLFNSWFLLAVNYFVIYWNIEHNPVAFSINFLQTNIAIGLLIWLTNRPTFALLCHLLFSVMMVIASEVIFSFWNRGLEMQDFAHLKGDKISTTLELIVEYESFPQAILLLFSFTFVFGIYWYYSPQFITNTKTRYAYLMSAICVLITSLNLIVSPPNWLRNNTESLYRIMQNDIIAASGDMSDENNIPLKWQASKKVNRMLGPVSSLMFETIMNGGNLLSLGSVMPQKVVQKSDIAKDHAQDFFNKLEPHQQNRVSNGSMPDVVVMLHESTMDISMAQYPFTQNLNFALFGKDKYTKMHGLLNVDTYGGNTWISEYEMMSGVPVRVFDGHTDLPYVFVNRTNHSLISEFKRMGYETYMVYPVHKSFAQAASAYRELGVDHMYDVLDYGYERGERKWYDVPDKVVGDIVVDCLNKVSSKPKFIFVTTMSNHGPHDSYYKDKLGCKSSLNEWACGKLNDYVDRLQASDDDHHILTKQLLDRAKPTIFVNFGDHQPSFEGYFPQVKFDDNLVDQYKTFYSLKANFDIHVDKQYPVLDLSFLSGLLLDAIDAYDSEYFNLNMLMRMQCDGRLSKCEYGNKSDTLLDSYKAYLYDDLEFSEMEYYRKAR